MTKIFEAVFAEFYSCKVSMKSVFPALAASIEG